MGSSKVALSAENRAEVIEGIGPTRFERKGSFKRRPRFFHARECRKNGT
jgi:hypothetical protein